MDMFGALTYKRPVNLVMAANLAAYAVLYFYGKSSGQNAFLMFLLVTAMICTVYYLIAGFGLGDEYLFLIVSMLFSIGLLMISRLDAEAGGKQLIWFAAGIVLFFAAFFLFTRLSFWDRLGLFYAAGTILLNMATLIFGRKINGATNWVIVGGHSFQLSELSKILFLLFLACFFKDRDLGMIQLPGLKRLGPGIQNRLFLMAVTFVNVLLLVLQREWGTVALFFILYLIILYVCDSSRPFLLLNAACSIPVALSGYFFIPHIRVRVDMWLNPWSDASGKGYQILQSLFAIGSGGFLGSGIASGRPDLIPAVDTDFIFSAICEELGIMSGIAVILLYFILFYRGVKIGLGRADRFYKILSLGISVMFGIQTFIIIGGVIKLIPLTGITLPFVSYGGSSLVSSFAALGMLQAVSALRPELREAGGKREAAGAEEGGTGEDSRTDNIEEKVGESLEESGKEGREESLEQSPEQSLEESREEGLEQSGEGSGNG
jgi:cell division protein FtsW (lipid II flippase)